MDLIELLWCIICLNMISEDHIILNCGHAFCRGCIHNWNMQPRTGLLQCPMCRDPITYSIHNQPTCWQLSQIVAGLKKELRNVDSVVAIFMVTSLLFVRHLLHSFLMNRLWYVTVITFIGDMFVCDPKN